MSTGVQKRSQRSYLKMVPKGTISARAIYSYIKDERPDLTVCLPERGKTRRCGGDRKRKKHQQATPEKRSIELRPRSVEKRKRVGHWEGDTIVSCRGGKGGVLSLVERATRFGFYQLLPDLKSETVLSVLRAFFERVPRELRLSLTLDNGSEFGYSTLVKLEKRLFLPIYYCHPYCSQERGTVERRNRNIRWYFPKGTDFQNVDKRVLQNAVQKIHYRPMKCLKYRSASEVWGDKLKTIHNRKLAA